MVRCILFDFDGTLADSKRVALELLNETAERHGYRRMRPDELPELIRMPLKERLKRFGVPAVKLPALALELRRLYGERIAAVPVFADMVPVVRSLSRSYKLAILSSNEPESIRRVLRSARLELFDSIDASFNLFGKAAKIKGFLRRSGLSARELLYVGDELRDVEACKQAGVRCAAVTWGFDAASLLAQGKPDFLVHHPSDLLAVAKAAR